MGNVTEYFICNTCGKEKARSEKPSTHKAHGIDECNDCYSAKAGQRAVEKAKKKKAEHTQRIIDQQMEREIKRDKQRKAMEVSRQPTKKSPCTPETKLRRDAIEFERELKSINGEYEL